MANPIFSIATAAAVLCFAVPATAATVVSGVVHEGNGAIGVGPAPAPDIVLGDFNEMVNDPLLELAGDTTIYGGVTSTKNFDLYTDAFTVDFGTTSYQVDFTWTDATGSGLDGQIVVDGVSYALGSTAAEDLGVLTGVVTFIVDPTDGAITVREDAYWTLTMAAVPLPAAGLLLLGALGGLGFARRRKAA